LTSPLQVPFLFASLGVKVKYAFTSARQQLIQAQRDTNPLKPSNIWNNISLFAGSYNFTLELSADHSKNSLQFFFSRTSVTTYASSTDTTNFLSNPQSSRASLSGQTSGSSLVTYTTASVSVVVISGITSDSHTSTVGSDGHVTLITIVGGSHCWVCYCFLTDVWTCLQEV
jgi:hypothetical protein